jgi:hypothetical protein
MTFRDILVNYIGPIGVVIFIGFVIIYIIAFASNIFSPSTPIKKNWSNEKPPELPDYADVDKYATEEELIDMYGLP